MSKRLIIFLILNVVNLYLVSLFTVSPKVISGNGNLGILSLFSGAILLIMFLKELWKELNIKEFYVKKSKKVLWFSIAAIIICSYLEVKYIYNQVALIGGTPTDPDSNMYRLFWINQYTNTLILNVYTFIIVTSFLLFFFSVKSRLKSTLSRTKAY
jgi:hypothetical protein